MVINIVYLHILCFKLRLQTYMSKQTKLKMPKLNEEAPSIFDYNVNPHSGKWFHWDTMIKVRVIDGLMLRIEYKKCTNKITFRITLHPK